ncbi:sensor histidine kinase [Flavitalea sp.]|nr:histidine kinase [Flavitalea sp.]
MNGKPVNCGILKLIGLAELRRVNAVYYILPLVLLISNINLAQQVQQPPQDRQLITTIDSQSYRAVLWKRTDGLSLPKKNAMIKDVYGFLWIISPVGLNRFDGNTFRIFYPDKSTPGSVSGSYSFSLVEDSLHNIWVGTNKGLSRYDIKADTFTNFSPGVISVTSIATVVPFWATKDELYCLEAGNKIVRYNIHSLKKTELVTLDKAGPQVTNATVRTSVYDSVSNSLYLLTGGPGINGGGLLQILLNEKRTIHYQWPCYHNIEKHAHFSYAIQFDKKRRSLWINSVDGLLEFNLNGEKFHDVPACSDLMELANYEIMAGMDIDKAGNVWYFSQSRGILIYNPSTNIAKPLFKDPVTQHYFSEDNMDIYCDRDGMIWFGNLSTSKGVHQLIPFSPSVSRLSIPYTTRDGKGQEDGILFISKGNGQKVWASTIRGIKTPGYGTDKSNLLKDTSIPSSLQNHCIALGINDQKTKAWFYDWKNMSLIGMDLQSRKLLTIIVRDLNNKEFSKINLLATTIKPYKNGFIFLIDYKGIFYYDSDSTVARQIIDLPYHVTNVAMAVQNRIFLRLHFGYTNLSFVESGKKWTRSSTPLDSVEWSCIFYDSINKSYWVGGVKQLYHYDGNFKLIKRYIDNDGLAGNDVLSIQQDEHGHIWFNSSDGDISRLNTESDVITILSEKDGYKRQVFSWMPPHVRDESGNLYFLGHDGIDKIEPDKIDRFPPAIVYMKSLAINQQPIDLPTGINNLHTLKLKYDQSPIAIETGVIDFYSKGKSSIRYRLEGINENWQYAPGNYSIRFEKLPPGKYRLVIQASNSGNNFTGPENILFIAISPAFYKTWWFMALMALFILGVIYGIARFRLKEKFRLQLETSAKDMQLAEMRQKTTELEMQALRTQMNPHFIFNSLNSINRFILQNNRTQASEYLTKFSKLMRMILQNSQASLITLESELESLRLYLDLESLRFNYHFSYRISFSSDMDVSAFKLPPLIVQPYAENAIWHGLMHKEEKGNLDIEITEEDGFLFLKIADDGIGRKQSAAIHEKSDTRHKPMGLKITADRIAILQPGESSDKVVRIVDLVAPDGSPAGTEVIIKIPVIYN